MSDDFIFIMKPNEFQMADDELWHARRNCYYHLSEYSSYYTRLVANWQKKEVDR